VDYPKCKSEGNAPNSAEGVKSFWSLFLREVIAYDLFIENKKGFKNFSSKNNFLYLHYKASCKDFSTFQNFLSYRLSGHSSLLNFI